MGKEPSKSPSKTYEVGYGRPPEQFRFRKGESGNPDGKAKKTKAPNLKAPLQVALARPTTTRSGKRQKIYTKAVAGIEHLVDQWAKGDRHARRDLILLCKELGVDLADRQALQGALDEALSAEDEALLADFVRRFGGKYPVDTDTLLANPAKDAGLLSSSNKNAKLLAPPENLVEAQKAQDEE